MAIREILRLGNPVLFEKCREVRNFNSGETAEAVCDLRETLLNFRKRKGFGRAIAAPQIGITKRIIYIHYRKKNLSGPIINPVIIRKSREKIRLWDDCFSFPNMMVEVERFKKIEVEFFNSSKEKISVKAEGDLSELLQHEIDHLDGILSVQRAIGPKAFALRDEWENFIKDRY
jgi:peptide deformylase